MLVIPWTVDSPRQMRRTLLLGVDGIITNYPARLTEAVARLQKAVRAARARRISSRGLESAALATPMQERGLLRNVVQAPPPIRQSTIKEML